MTIFQKSVINRHLDNLDKEQVEKAYQKFRENYSPAKIEEIKKLKEEEYQDGFLRDLFVDVFGYILKPDSNYNLAREFKNQGDGKKEDNFEIDKLSKKLNAFYDFDFKTLVLELKKKKNILSLLKQDEWKKYFNVYKSEINKLQDEINTTDKEIDKLVYELYELTEAEIKIVEESV